MMDGEGDAWLERNRDKLGKHDPVISLLREMMVMPRAVLEIGCANGWRLDRMRRLYHCMAFGIDPSAVGAAEATSLGLTVVHGTARDLPYMSRSMDLVIFGFCLYLTDPEDWFRIVSEANRVLEDNGLLVIHDFYADEGLHGVPYEHHEGITSWHFDFAQLWLAHPLYTLMRRQVHGTDCVTILRKRPAP